MIWILMGCYGQTRVVTEGGNNLYSKQLVGGVFESGDRLLVGSGFCLYTADNDQDHCLKMSSAVPMEEPDSGEEFCFAFPDLGIAEVAIEPVTCDQDTDFSEPDRVVLDVVSTDQVRAELVWPIEEEAAAMLDSDSWQLFGPDFAIAGVVPSPDTPLWIWPDSRLPVSLELSDSLGPLAWSVPWRVDVTGADLDDEGAWSFSTAGGQVALTDDSEQEIVARTWSVADLEQPIESRLHVGVQDATKAEVRAVGELGFVYSPGVHGFVEVTGPEGQVIKGAPVAWSLEGVRGAALTVHGDPAAASVDLSCAMSWRIRQERMSLHAELDGVHHSEAFWVTIPAMPRDRDTKRSLQETCQAQTDLSGCSQAPARALLLPGLLGLFGLLLRRREA